jgi:hypothetical protein
VAAKIYIGYNTAGYSTATIALRFLSIPAPGRKAQREHQDRQEDPARNAEGNVSLPESNTADAASRTASVCGAGDLG